MDASSAFTGPSLTFGVTGEGVSIDPVTGLLSILTDRLHEGVTVTVAATDSEGVIQTRLTLTVAADGVAPALVTAPSTEGEALVERTVTAQPGVWSGTPLPAVAFQWVIDGAPVSGATEATYVPEAADDGRMLALRVTATNAHGSAEATAPAAKVTRVPPTALGALPDVVFALGAGSQTVAAGADFVGAGLTYAVTGPGAAIDAATGLVTLATDSAVEAVPITVTATNSGGTASSSFRLSIRAAQGPEQPVLAPPMAVGGLAPLVYAAGSGARTVSAAALFAGEALTYALERATAGVTIDPGAGLVTIPTDAALDAAEIAVTATNAAGSARQTFTVTVRASVVTVFGGAAALGTVTFLTSGAAPSWTPEAAGFARLVPASRTHGDWALARGHGRYRCLARWTAADTSTSAWVPFALGQVSKTGTDFHGICADVIQLNGVPRMELRRYTGSGTVATRIAIANAPWKWDAWHWVELELDGALVRARVYPEEAMAPAWQVQGEAQGLAPGAVGPGGYPLSGQKPTIDIKRLEYHPILVQTAVQPAAPRNGDWVLEQFTERT